MQFLQCIQLLVAIYVVAIKTFIYCMQVELHAFFLASYIVMDN